MNLTCLGFALAATIAPYPNVVPSSCPAELKANKTQHSQPETVRSRRFPSLTVGERLPNTPLESLRRLIAIRNAEESLESQPSIELIGQAESEAVITADVADEPAERSIEVLATAEPMQPETETIPESPRFVSGAAFVRSRWTEPLDIAALIAIESSEEVVTADAVDLATAKPMQPEEEAIPEAPKFDSGAEFARSRWTEPLDIAALIAIDSSEVASAVARAIVIVPSRKYEDSLPLPPAVKKVVETQSESIKTASTKDQQKSDDVVAGIELASRLPILPELAEDELLTASLDPSTNGELACNKTQKSQTTEIVEGPAESIDETLVVATTDSVDAPCGVDFFDDDFEEVDEMIEYERIALESAIKTLR